MVDVPRPAPPRSVAERIRDQIEFIGVARLLSATVAVVAVVGGAWFLVADAGPPPEADLPRVVPVAASEGDPTSSTVVPVSSSSPVPSTTVAGASTATDAPIVVHVAGAVLSPGVHELRVGDRIADAVARAGGPAEGADLDALNLAAPVVDGARIVVPVDGEEAVVEIPPGLDPSGPTEATTGALDGDVVGPIDVNRADATELDTLPGVGPATAEAIVMERERNGPFSSIDDLERVPGIGPAKLAALREEVTT
ncbi:MAG: helix-hairpin-helix domain-containing protein [Actinomycetota bacterium]